MPSGPLSEDDLQAHASQRWSFRGAALAAALKRSRGSLALGGLDKKLEPIRQDLSFLAHFCDAFMDIPGGKIHRSLQIVQRGLDRLVENPSGLLTLAPASAEATRKVKDVFSAAAELFRK